jgi:hypothetical protein
MCNDDRKKHLLSPPFQLLLLTQATMVAPAQAELLLSALLSNKSSV